MSLVGINNEPLLERAVFGFDGTSYRVIKVDTDGNLVAAVKASQEIEIVQDTAADLNATVTIPTDQDIEARSFGWINGAWQKNPLMLGYSSSVSEYVTNANASAGNNWLNGTVVPAGEIWLIELIAVNDLNTAITRIELTLNVNSVNIVNGVVATPIAGRWEPFTDHFTLYEGDYVRAFFIGCTLNDDIRMGYHGIIVDIDQ